MEILLIIIVGLIVLGIIGGLIELLSKGVYHFLPAEAKGVVDKFWATIPILLFPYFGWKLGDLINGTMAALIGLIAGFLIGVGARNEVIKQQRSKD